MVPKKQRCTVNMLSSHEEANVLGTRGLQISLGAPVMVNNVPAGSTVLEIAKMELNAGVLPMVIRRPLSTGRYEQWELSELYSSNP